MLNKVTLLLLALIAAGPALAGPLSKTMKSEIASDLAKTCLESKTKDASQPFCRCVAESYVAVIALEDETDTALKEYAWIKKLYKRQLSQEEYASDVHALTELIDEIHSGCLKDSSFRWGNRK